MILFNNVTLTIRRLNELLWEKVKKGSQMRTMDDEIIHRKAQRRRYFEDPNYRKWSDVVSDNINYGEWSDDVLFVEYVANKDIETTSRTYLYELLETGHELPINWENFYAYFDERLCDTDNCLRSELTSKGYAYHNLDPFDKETIEDTLNKYRDSLLSPTYDMV